MSNSVKRATIPLPPSVYGYLNVFIDAGLKCHVRVTQKKINTTTSPPTEVVVGSVEFAAQGFGDNALGAPIIQTITAPSTQTLDGRYSYSFATGPNGKTEKGQLDLEFWYNNPPDTKRYEMFSVSKVVTNEPSPGTGENPSRPRIVKVGAQDINHNWRYADNYNVQVITWYAPL